MAAELITVAEAIRDDIETARLASYFGAVVFSTRVMWAKRDIDLENLDGASARVDVVPQNFDVGVGTRGIYDIPCRFEILVRRKFGLADADSTGDIQDDEVKELVNLLNDLLGFWLPTVPTGQARDLLGGLAKWKDEPEGFTPVTIDWASLVKNRQFNGVFPLTYLYTRDIG